MFSQSSEIIFLSTYGSRFVSFMPYSVALNRWLSMKWSLTKAIIWPECWIFMDKTLNHIALITMVFKI